MMVDGPAYEACRECWQPPETDGSLPCGHELGVHRWTAPGGWFAVAHPALSQPIAGHFLYPVDTAQVARFVARHRIALRRVFGVDTRVPMTWWIEVDPTPPYEALGLKPS